jgi:exopolysaccharide/PEP-CTERM locus tyrosine autokinase
MGRIEDALRKLESERRQPASKRATPSPQPAERPTLERFSLEAAEHSLELDEIALARWMSVTMLGSNEHAKKEYGQVKRPIIDQAMGQNSDLAAGMNVVLVSSAGPGEGKTVTALNLALSLAREKDLSVLLMDADVPNPELSSALGLQRSPGLANLLGDGRLQIKDVTYKTSVPRLYFIPAGTERSGAAELLGSQRMDELVTMLGQDLRRTIAVIDSSPLLLTNESRVLASLAGQIVLVVRADKTPRLVVTEAISYLDPEKPVGLVLNGTSGPETAYYAGVYGDAETSGLVQSAAAENA